jgi:hypothetical protein
MTVGKGGVSPAKGSSGWALQLRSKQWVQSSGSMADKAIVCITEQIYSGSKAMSTSGQNGWINPGIAGILLRKQRDVKRWVE